MKLNPETKKQLKDILYYLKYLLAIILFVAALITIAIVYSRCGCPKICRPSIVEYSVSLSECEWTPLGSCVLLNGNIVDDEFYEMVDGKISATVECLDEYFPRYKAGTQKRKCFVVYLPESWRWSCELADGERQMIFGELRDEACALKGFKPREGCTCGARVAIMYGDVIVVPPSLDFLRMGVLEYLSGWRQAELWADEKMVECGGF